MIQRLGGGVRSSNATTAVSTNSGNISSSSNGSNMGGYGSGAVVIAGGCTAYGKLAIGTGLGLGSERDGLNNTAAAANNSGSGSSSGNTSTATNTGSSSKNNGKGNNSKSSNKGNSQASAALSPTGNAALRAQDLILLSLRTLASLSVPSIRLILLVQQSVMPYLCSDNYRIRSEAATTCAKMIVTCVQRCPTRGPTALSIEDIISRLLEVVVADTSSLVGECIIIIIYEKLLLCTYMSIFNHNYLLFYSNLFRFGWQC